MDDSKYIARIREILPDTQIRTATKNAEGLMNDVFEVNGEYVFRFARDPSDKTLYIESHLLNHIRSHIELRIPEPFYSSEDAMAYTFISGQSLSRKVIRNLSDVAQQSIADQLGQFVNNLHHVPLTFEIRKTLVPCTYEAWQKIRSDVEAKVYPLLMAHQIEWAEDLFSGMLSSKQEFQYDVRLIHGDLAPYHILFVPKENRVSGIIDFGVAGLGDPALDFGSLLYAYGESFVRRLERTYPFTESLFKRARFYAQAIELRWTLAGLKTGETLWFLAHLGGSKEIDHK